MNDYDDDDDDELSPSVKDGCDFEHTAPASHRLTADSSMLCVAADPRITATQPPVLPCSILAFSFSQSLEHCTPRVSE